MSPNAVIAVENIPVELTPRLRAEAEQWRARGRRPRELQALAPGQLSVWDFPRPPAMQRVLDRVTVELGGTEIAASTRALRICETASPPTYYIPPEDFREGTLVLAPGRSLCEWKGEARYWSLRNGSAVAEQAAWSYDQPYPEYALLAHAVAVYPAAVDRCTVAGVTVAPQPGGYYGGWVTPDLAGPFKGVPGSDGW